MKSANPNFSKEHWARGFTLLELLTVISIIGVLAAIALPNIGKFKPNVTAAGSRQLLDAISRGRQLAISQRTTVYMVFVPTNFWTYSAYTSLPDTEKEKGRRLFDKQCVGYTFVTLRSLGDQPGRPTARYLDNWKTLPEGVFIPLQKFGPRNVNLPVMRVYTNSPPPALTPLLAFEILGFNVTNGIPFPSEFAPAASGPDPWVPLPYIAFNHMGQVTSGRDEQIPLALGTVSFSRDQATREPTAFSPTFNELPRGNSTNTFNLVNIDWLTGRARVERQQIQ